MLVVPILFIVIVVPNVLIVLVVPLVLIVLVVPIVLVVLGVLVVPEAPAYAMFRLLCLMCLIRIPIPPALWATGGIGIVSIKITSLPTLSPGLRSGRFGIVAGEHAFHKTI